MQIPRGAKSTGNEKLTVKTLVKLSGARKAPTHGPEAHLAGLTGPLSQQLLIIANDVAAFWTQQANKANVQIPPTTATIVGSTPSTCGTQPVTTNDPAIYCPSTNALLLSLGWFNKNYVPLGNAAVAEVVGELYGFHVSDVLGLLKLGDSGKLTHTDIYKTDICFSGAWMYTVYQRKLFQRGDLQALGKLFASYAGAGRVTARSWVSAFELGFQSGDPTKCIPAAARVL